MTCIATFSLAFGYARRSSSSSETNPAALPLGRRGDDRAHAIGQCWKVSILLPDGKCSRSCAFHASIQSAAKCSATALSNSVDRLDWNGAIGSSIGQWQREVLHAAEHHADRPASIARRTTAQAPGATDCRIR